MAVKNPGKVYWAGPLFALTGTRPSRSPRTFTRDYDGKKVPGWWLKLEPLPWQAGYPGVGISVEKVIEEDDAERPEYRERVPT